MLKKFSKKGEYTHILIIFIILIINYFTPPLHLMNENASSMGPIGIWLSEQSLAVNPAVIKVSVLFLLVLISYYLNRVVAQVDIYPKQSYLSATLLIALFLFSPGMPDIISTIILCGLMCVCLGSMINMFGKQYPYLQILNSSIAIAIASMIIPHTILFILFIWFGFLTYSVNTWREWIISIIGLVIPYLYMFFAYFWNDNLDYLIGTYRQLFYFNFFHFTIPTGYTIVSVFLLLMMYFISTFSFTSDASDKIISIRKRMWLIFQFSIVTVLILVLLPNAAYVLLPILYIPLALMMTYLVHYQRKSVILDIFMVLFVVSILINRIFA
jgi:hypothetical protein